MPVKTFTAGEVLTAADTNAYLNNSGLVYIGAVTLNAVTNNVSNVFSSTYNAYRVIISDLDNATTTVRALTLRFRTTVDDTGANYFSFQEFFYGASLNGFSSAVGQTSSALGSISDATNGGGSLAIDIHNPNLAKTTTYFGNMVTYQQDVLNYVMRDIGGGVNTTTQYTGFSIIGTTDNLSGTVRVYGYRQA